jgi:DNA-binding NtrC family response regulator
MPDETIPIRMILLGPPGTEIRHAAEMARDSGADVTLADDTAHALATLREHGSDLVMIDVAIDTPAFLRALRAERFAVPVLACGIGAPAERAVAAVRAGAWDYVPLPLERALIAAAIAAVARRPAAIIGEAPALRQAVRFGLAMAPAGAAILVTGEHGAGKALMARTIHDSSRLSGPFVMVDCACLDEAVLESELFGHEAGDFPGAVARRVGRIDEARGGTLFLREIGALPAHTQARLLDLLQGSVGHRIGGPRMDQSARLIASNIGDLHAEVASGSFRADLLARFGMIQVALPPLRARGDDIALLARHFAHTANMQCHQHDGGVDDDALDLLGRHDWPGNVRELEATVHRAAMLAGGRPIAAADIVLNATRAPARTPVDSLVGRTMAEVERELILHTLEKCRGNRTTASSILGISVRTMRNKLRTFMDAGFPVSPC